MFHVAAGRRVAAAVAVAALLSYSAPARAQDMPELDAPLDPSAPLDPLPELGVDWPDLDQTPEQLDVGPGEDVGETGAERSYRVSLTGLDAVAATDLLARFNSLSVLEANRGDPANAAQIDRRAREDAGLLTELLRAAGHYDAEVVPSVEVAGAAYRVVLEAQPGPVYTYADVRLPGLETAPDAAALRQAFAIAPGEPVSAAAAAAGEAALRLELGKRGYAFAEIGTLEVEVDRAARTATLLLPVEPNGSRRFGQILVEGRPLFSAEHIAIIARFDPGQPFTASRLEDLRRALIATGLVSAVAIRPVARKGTETVDIAVALTPAPLRTVAGEAGYGTGEGARVELSWEHRNLIRPEGAVRFRGVLGTQEQSVGATLRRSNFGRRDRVLTGNVLASRIDRAAYDASTFLVGIGLERQSNIVWQKKWTWSVGADLLASDERDVNLASGMSRERTFFIGALPAALAYDGSNDLLDPSSGFRLAG